MPDQGPGTQLRGPLGQVVAARLFPESLEDKHSPLKGLPPSLAESPKIKTTHSQTKVKPPLSDSWFPQADIPPDPSKAEFLNAKVKPSAAGSLLCKEARQAQPKFLPPSVEEASTSVKSPPPLFKAGSLEAVVTSAPAADHAPPEDILCQAAGLLQAAEGEHMCKAARIQMAVQHIMGTTPWSSLFLTPDSDSGEFQEDPVLQVLRVQRAELQQQKW